MLVCGIASLMRSVSGMKKKLRQESCWKYTILDFVKGKLRVATTTCSALFKSLSTVKPVISTLGKPISVSILISVSICICILHPITLAYQCIEFDHIETISPVGIPVKCASMEKNHIVDTKAGMGKMLSGEGMSQCLIKYSYHSSSHEWKNYDHAYC